MQEVTRSNTYWIQSLACVAVSVAFLVIFSLFPVPKKFVVGVWCSTLSYIESPVLVMRNTFETFADFILARKTLNRKITEMELRMMAMQHLIEKNALPIEECEATGYILADIIARSQTDWWQEFEINKGSLDGVEKHSAVIADGYLVGKVADVYPHASRVVLITSSEFSHVVTVEDTRDLGIISGDGQGNIILSFIPIERTLTKGMKIFTSIMSNSVPSGIAVGEVFSAGEDKNLYKDYNIKAGAHLTQLYAVAIIKNASDKNSDQNLTSVSKK